MVELRKSRIVMRMNKEDSSSGVHRRSRISQERVLALYNSGLSVAQIAAITKVGRATVYKRLSGHLRKPSAAKTEESTRRQESCRWFRMSGGEKLEMLERLIDRRPVDYGIEADLWDSGTLDAYIFRLYKARVKEERLYAWLIQAGVIFPAPQHRPPAASAAKGTKVLWVKERHLRERADWLRGWGITPMISSLRSKCIYTVAQVATGADGRHHFFLRSREVNETFFTEFLSRLVRDFEPGASVQIMCDKAALHTGPVYEAWCRAHPNVTLVAV